MKTALSNHTPYAMRISDVGVTGISTRRVIPAGGKWPTSVDRNATYREHFLRVTLALPNDYDRISLNSVQDVGEFKKIRVICQSRDNVVSRVGSPRRHGTSINMSVGQDGTAWEAAKDKVSPKFDAASRSCTDLKELLIGVKICRRQCNHLVETCVKGMEKMTELYSQAPVQCLFKSGGLKELYNHLDRLEYIFCDVKDLLAACANDLRRVALVVSMPMPPEEDMEVCSMFDLLLGEVMWNLDLIEHVLQPAASVKLRWSSTARRYALDGSWNVDSVHVDSSMMKPEDVCSLAHTDRKDLQRDLENGTLVLNPNTSGTSINDERILEKIIIERCKVEMHLEMSSTDHGLERSRNVSMIRRLGRVLFKADHERSNNPSKMFQRLVMDRVTENRKKASCDPKCFEINHLDLKIKFDKFLGGGSFKKIYEGEWCGQRVAIATIRHCQYEDLKKEVKLVLGLQHPKVVSFFGWACADVACKEYFKNDDEEREEDVGVCTGGFIVTEIMECDLVKLIKTTKKLMTIQKDTGGPFSHFVGLDILLQIVEAMLHVRKQKVMHRDLKPGNFLVNSRSSPRPDGDIYYDVKLIDFGSSKLLGEDEHTYKKGTSRYGAPEMMAGSAERKGKYDESVDVFSFAMTCYQVITGLVPLWKYTSPTEARRMLQEGERPEIPSTVLIGFKELMEACWAHDPKSRPTFEKIQERLWTIKKELAVHIRS